jgi:hypothetical protein
MINWDLAPEWARYAAMDNTSGWYWYSHKPIWREDIQAWDTTENWDQIDMTDWARTSLQERPHD